MKFGIEKVENDDIIAVGASKLFGMPDLSYNFDWPTVKADGEEFDLEFLAQINFDEIPSAGLKGMLYLFYDLYVISEGEALESDSVAAVYDEKPIDLARCAFVSEAGEADEDYDEAATGVYRPVFGTGDNALLEKNDDGTVTLFSLSFPHTEYGLDGKKLTVKISAEDLEKHNFKKIKFNID